MPVTPQRDTRLLRGRLAEPAAALLLVAAVLALYLPALRGGFVWLDHREIVEGALIVQRLRDVPGLFVNDGNFAGYHRPIYDLLHSLDRALWGLDPFGFHLSSLVLHVVNALGVFVLARRLGDAWRSTGPRFALAALWALHPVHNPVAGLIHAKADLFVTTMLLATLAALAAALRRERLRAAPLYAAAALAFAIALYTKELAVALPLALVAGLPWARLQERTRRRLAVAIGGGFALCALVLVQRGLVGGASGYSSPIALPERLLTFATVWIDYIRGMVLPFDPALADTTTVWSALEVGVRARYAIALVLLVLLGASTWRRLPDARPFLALHVAFLLPVAQVVPLLHFRAERFMYLPALGLVGTAVVLVRAGVRRRPRNIAFALASSALCAVLIVGWMRLGRARIATFEDDVTLFTRELGRKPDSREGAAALARALDRAGRFDEATPFQERAARIDPRRLSYAAEGTLAVNHAHNLLARGRFDEALAVIEQRGALALLPREREELAYNRAIALSRVGRPNEALEIFEDYVSAHPLDASAHFLLGRSAAAAGEPARARAAWRRYLELAPEAPDAEQVRAWLAELDADS